MNRCLLLSVFGLLALSSQASAQEALTSTNQVIYDFADYTAAGFAPAPGAGQLDSDEWIATGVLGQSLEFGDTSANEDFANGVSVGGETAGGVWAFTPVPAQCGSGMQTMLGVQPSTMTFSPGSFQLRIQNTTGAQLTELHLQYGLAWFNDSGRSSIQTVSILQVDEAGATTGTVDVATLEMETPVDADAIAAWDGQCQSAVVNLAAAPIADGDNFVIAFSIDDANGSGTRDEIAIGELQVSAMAVSDAGPVMDVDAGTADAGIEQEPDAARLETPDSGSGPGASDAGSGNGGEELGADSGCGCSSGTDSPGGALGVFLLFLAGFSLRRKRRAA